MLISKRFPGTGDRLASRFGDDAPGDFPLRRYLRLREDFGADLAQAALTGILAALVPVLGRSLDVLCRAHGGPHRAWCRIGVWAAAVILTLSVLRHLYYKIMEMRQIRREMSALRAAFRLSGDEDGPAGAEDRGRG